MQNIVALGMIPWSPPKKNDAKTEQLREVLDGMASSCAPLMSIPSIKQVDYHHVQILLEDNA